MPIGLPPKCACKIRLNPHAVASGLQEMKPSGLNSARKTAQAVSELRGEFNYRCASAGSLELGFDDFRFEVWIGFERVRDEAGLLCLFE